MSKGSGDRVTDKKRFDENYGKIRWSAIEDPRKWDVNESLDEYVLRLYQEYQESPPESICE